MKATLIGLVLVSLLAFASATAYFQEDFDGNQACSTFSSLKLFGTKPLQQQKMKINK